MVFTPIVTLRNTFVFGRNKFWSIAAILLCVLLFILFRVELLCISHFFEIFIEIFNSVVLWVKLFLYLIEWLEVIIQLFSRISDCYSYTIGDIFIFRHVYVSYCIDYC